MTSLPGAFLGGIIVGVVEAVGTSASIFDSIPGSPGTFLVFVVLLAVLIVRPQGLLGQKGR
jgi:branched-subunit amino acid ABC-type transport system permease component